MTHHAVVSLAVLLLVGCSRGTPEEQLAAVKKQYEGARDYYQHEYQKAATEEEADQVFRRLFPNREYFSKKFKEVAENNVGHEVEAEALAWLANHGKSTDQNSALEALFSRHIEADCLSEVALRLRHETQKPKTEQRLKKLVECSPHHSVKAHALFALAEFYRKSLRMKARLNDGSDTATIEKYHSQTAIEYWRTLDVSMNDVESLYEQIAADYADVGAEVSDHSPAERATAALFEMRQLQNGQPAPEIEGTDLHGKPIRLSDFRGKVVLLSFWGHW